MISAIGNFSFKIGESRVVKNIFPKKISNAFRQSNHFKKIGNK